MPMVDNLPPPAPLPDDALVPDMPTLARVLGELPGSATAHLLAACDTGGWPVIVALRPQFPDLVAAWEAWRRAPVKTAGQIRAGLIGRTSVRTAS